MGSGEFLTEYDTIVYKLRAGAPMPLDDGNFVLHTFMAEKTTINVFLCTDTLPSSSDFRGLGGNLVSANFSRLKNEGGGHLFQGTQNNEPMYIDEEDIANG